MPEHAMPRESRTDLRHDAARRRAVARLQHDAAGKAAGRARARGPRRRHHRSRLPGRLARRLGVRAGDRARGRRARSSRASPAAMPRTSTGPGRRCATPRGRGCIVFLATSAIHREYKLNMASEEIIHAAAEGVKYARDRCARTSSSRPRTPRAPSSSSSPKWSSARSRPAPRRSTSRTPSATRCRRNSTRLFQYLQASTCAASTGSCSSVHCHNDLGHGRGQQPRRGSRGRAAGRMHDQRHRRARRQLLARGARDGAQDARGVLRSHDRHRHAAALSRPAACSRPSPACRSRATRPWSARTPSRTNRASTSTACSSTTRPTRSCDREDVGLSRTQSRARQAQRPPRLPRARPRARLRARRCRAQPRRSTTSRRSRTRRRSCSTATSRRSCCRIGSEAGDGPVAARAACTSRATRPRRGSARVVLRHTDGREVEVDGDGRRSGRCGLQGRRGRDRRRRDSCASSRSAAYRWARTRRARPSSRSSTADAPIAATSRHDRHRRVGRACVPRRGQPDRGDAAVRRARRHRAADASPPAPSPSEADARRRPPRTLFDKIWDRHVVVAGNGGYAGGALRRPAPGARGHLAAGVRRAARARTAAAPARPHARDDGPLDADRSGADRPVGVPIAIESAARQVRQLDAQLRGVRGRAARACATTGAASCTSSARSSG